MGSSIASELLLAACMFLGAELYTSVGHADASAYIASMALSDIASTVMRPTALALLPPRVFPGGPTQTSTVTEHAFAIGVGVAVNARGGS
jgi:hypothetical protein